VATVVLTKYYSGDRKEKNEIRRACCNMGTREVYTGFWWGTRTEDDLEDAGIDGKIILKWIFRKWVGGAWTGVIWHRTGTGGGHL